MLAAPGDAARAGACLVHRFRVGSEAEQEFAHGERSTLVPGSHVERRLAVLRACVMRSVRERGVCAERLGGVRHLVGLVHARSAAQEQCEDGRVAVACSRLVQWRPSHVVSNIHVVTHLAQHGRHFVDLTFLNDFKQLSGSAGLPYRHRAIAVSPTAFRWVLWAATVAPALRVLRGTRGGHFQRTTRADLRHESPVGHPGTKRRGPAGRRDKFIVAPRRQDAALFSESVGALSWRVFERRVDRSKVEHLPIG